MFMINKPTTNAHPQNELMKDIPPNILIREFIRNNTESDIADQVAEDWYEQLDN